MARTSIDLIADEGLDPTGKVDSLDAWKRGITAALKSTPPLTLELPGADTRCIVSDTIDVALGSKSLAIVGDGGKVLATPGWKLPPRHGDAWQQGRHLFHAHDGAAFAFEGLKFDYQGAQQPDCVGDIVRLTRIGTANARNVLQYNPRGLTTSSRPDMPETFTWQNLRCGLVTLDGCHAVSLDGAHTATGIVAHFCDDATIRNTLVAFLMGQGFGCFSGRIVRWLANWAHANHHNYNVETGTEGLGQVLIGDPKDDAQRCHSSNATAAGIVVNQNGKPFSGPGVDAYALESTGDRFLLQTVGRLNTGGPTNVPVILERFKVASPTLGLVNVLGGGNPADVGIRAMTLHNPNRVPVLVPPSLKVPAKWEITAA